MKTRIGAAVALAVLASVMPLLAHHTAAYTYDVSKSVALSGTVTEVEWKQPHVLVHVDVTSTAGQTANWTIEMSGPQGGMYRRGVRPENFVKPGDPISLTVCVAKDGSHTASVRSVVVPAALDGKVGIC